MRHPLCSLALLGVLATLHAAEAPAPALTDAQTTLAWNRDAGGWRLVRVARRTPAGEQNVGGPTGEYTFLYSAKEPDRTPAVIPWSGPGGRFPEPSYRRPTEHWANLTGPVALNTAGEAHRFFPSEAEPLPAGGWSFRFRDDTADVRADWSLDSASPGDVRLRLTLTARQTGWFSLATPTLTEIAPENLAWAVVPGCFQGDAIEPDLPRSLGYGHGLPDRPLLVRERVASTLASIITVKSGMTLGVVAEPGTGADPWPADRDARQVWKLGLSHMNRAGRLAPTLYHPVLGQDGSRLQVGESVTLAARFCLRAGDWTAIVRHAAYDIYGLSSFLARKQPARSLSERLQGLVAYVTDAKTSLWRTEDFHGRIIGAQAYNGGVIGSSKDAMKNSDYGAMWMLAALTQDPVLQRERLPWARAFKLAQQQSEPGFFQGAAVGQYYLSKRQRFTEEWGNYVEPVALTFYTLLDLGNILLFTPGDHELRERLRLGADRLLSWQHPDGHWEVAYDRDSQRPMFTDLADLRPTFYGLLVAHRILGDDKYLQAARRGADWLIQRGVAHGQFLGVCGDARFTPDFATAQISQALLDLHAATGDGRYREAGIATGRFYLTSVFTHPLATGATKSVGSARRYDWEISQQGLGYEHGAAFGSANSRGPILLASHAGLFLRLHELTGETLFRDLARAGVWARDAFVDPATSVASYYWAAMNRGAGGYPHHAWWQIGWITDYLVAEAQLRSAGAVTFPRGFFTPKVGPHSSYGFAPGKILGETAKLRWGAVETGAPEVDFLLAESTGRRRVFVLLLNDSAHSAEARVGVNAAKLTGGRAVTWTDATLLASGETAHPAIGASEVVSVRLPPTGFAVLALDF